MIRFFMPRQISDQPFVTYESCLALQADFFFKSSLRVSQLVCIVTELAKIPGSNKEVQLHHGEYR